MDSDEIFTFYQSDLQSASFVAFEEMRKREELCDLTIKAGNNSISAHKVVLSAAIPYFRTLFTGHTAEAGEKDIGDLDHIAVELLINFAYTSKVAISIENAQSLLLAADILQLNQVKDACVEFLSKRLDANNVVQMRTLAFDLNISKLAKESDNYIRQNFQTFCKSDSFLNLSPSHVKEIISHDELNVSGEQIVFEAVMKWVKAWPSERTDKMRELLNEVRMVFLPPEYLIKNVSSEELIKTSFSCRDLIQNVQSYHLLSKRESAGLNLKTQPRKRKMITNAVYAICSSSTEMYSIYCCDFRSETWHRLSSRKLKEDSVHSVAAANGHIYVFLQNSVHTFDLETQVWKLLEPRHERIDGAAVLSYRNIIYFFGSSGGGFGDKVRRFYIQLEQWLLERCMTRRRSYCSAVSLGEGIYVTGGLYYADEILDTVERYSPSTDEWSECSPMITPRYHHGCVCMNDKIYACGGMTRSGPCGSAEVYDPLTDRWCPITLMLNKRRCFSLVLYNNKIYAVGGLGSDGKFTLNSEIYDSKWDRWKSGFGVPERFHYAVAI